MNVTVTVIRCNVEKLRLGLRSVRINSVSREWRVNLKVANVLPKSDRESDYSSVLRAGDGDPSWKVQTKCFHGDPAGKWSSGHHSVQRLSWTLVNVLSVQSDVYSVLHYYTNAIYFGVFILYQSTVLAYKKTTGSIRGRNLWWGNVSP